MNPQHPPSTRIRDAAVLLPVLALFLLMPPVITLFAVPIAPAGVPLIVVYLFGVWLAVIVCAALLARRLLPPATDGTDPPNPPDPPA